MFGINGPGGWQVLSDSLPVGAVIPFAGEITEGAGEEHKSPVIAMGWLPCDGRELKKGEYPELYSVLGKLYGESGDSFNIPDFRGKFLRCVGKGEPETEEREAATGGEPGGVGSVQKDAVMVHEHKYSSISAEAQAVPAEQAQTAGSVAPPKMVDTKTEAGLDKSEMSGAEAVRFSKKETRPLNVFVNCLIKFRYTGL